MRILVCLIAFACLSSCDKIVKPEPEVKVEVVTYDYNKDEAEKLSVNFDKLSKDDCMLVYKLFRSTSRYFERTSVPPELTSDALVHFGKVRDAYGWKPDTYKDLTDAVEKYLKDKGFSDPTWKFSDKKLEMMSAFNTIAESAKIAWLKKDVSK
jgi:hypothetical protein